LAAVDLHSRFDRPDGSRPPVTVAYDYPTPSRSPSGCWPERAAARLFEEELPASGPVDEPIAIVASAAASSGVHSPDDLWRLADRRW